MICSDVKVNTRFNMSFIFPLCIINASNAALASGDVIAQSVITSRCWLVSQKFPEVMRSGTRLQAADIMVFGQRPAIVCNCPVGLTCKTCPEDIVLEMVGVSDGLYFSQYSTEDVGEVFLNDIYQKLLLRFPIISQLALSCFCSYSFIPD